MKKLIVLGICIYLQACTTVGSVARPTDYPRYDETPAGSLNLVATEEGVEDEKIQALLHRQIKFPKRIRIALFKLREDNHWLYYSSDFTRLNKSIAENFVNKLRSSARVYDASYLPAMMIPEKRSLNLLREAAARFQADALLAYRDTCQSFQKYRFLLKDETRSYCSIEAVLIDVRNGVIAKSVVSVEEFSAKQKDKDKNFSETIKKAELEATAKALGSVAKEVVDYLKTVDYM